MRPVNFPSTPPPASDTAAAIQWIYDAIRQIELASHEDVAEVADAFIVENLTETRTLDPTTATTQEVAEALGTLIEDIRGRGTTRGA